MIKYLSILMAGLLVLACGTPQPSSFPKGAETARFEMRAEAFKRGLRGGQVVDPGVFNAGYSYLCLVDYGKMPAAKRALEAHKVAISPEHAPKTRVFGSNIGNQYQASFANHYLEPFIFQQFGCKLINVKFDQVITTDLRKILLWLAKHKLFDDAMQG